MNTLNDNIEQNHRGQNNKKMRVRVVSVKIKLKIMISAY